MEKINLPVATKLTSPNPLALICTEKPDGGTNLATISWWMPLSFNPAMMAFAMMKSSYSGERVRETKRAIVTVPGSQLKQAAIGCGSTSGRDTDKVAKFGITMQEMPDSAIKVPQDSRLAIECELVEFHETGDHYLYVCRVGNVYADESEVGLFAWNGYAEIAPAMRG